MACGCKKCSDPFCISSLDATTVVCSTPQCEQQISTDCVIYTGSDLECYGIYNGDTLTQILTVLSEKLYPECIGATTTTTTSTTTVEPVGTTTTTTTTTIPVSVIYYGASDALGTPSESDILLGSTDIQDGSVDVTIDYSLYFGTPRYLWWAIPAYGPAYLKNAWYENIINNGNMGNLGDLFEIIDIVNVSGQDYYVSKTAYPTEFSSPVLLQKI